jgi:O-antigen/teichoic acid export membrane protein
MGYYQKVLHGVGLETALKIATTVITMLKIFVLARLLIPRDFGLFSLVAIALGLMESLTETGINTTIVQSSKSVSYFLDTAWVIAILRGLVISILMILIGFWMKQYYHEDQLLNLVTLAACIPFIKGFINPAIISLRRDLNFFRDTLYRFSLLVVDAVVAIGFALFFHSTVVFILGMLVASVYEVIISFVLFRNRPRFNYIKSRAQEIFHNAKHLNVTAISNYVIQNVDNLLIGKYVGISDLGIYANGYSLSHKMNSEFSKSIQYATFPIYVKIAGDEKRLEKAFWKSTLNSMAFFIAISLPFIFFPQLIFVLLPKAKWVGVDLILPRLIIAGLIMSFTILASGPFIARKDYFWFNLHLVLNCVLMIPLIMIGSTRFGLSGAVNAVLFTRLVTLPIVGIGLWKTFQPRPRKLR